MNYNENQKAAIRTESLNTVVVSGPGSGKTRVLVARLAHMIARGVDPETITVITYTNAAADEIQERLRVPHPVWRERVDGGQMVGVTDSVKLGHCGTLHGWCMRFLQRHADEIGFATKITMLDEEQSKELLEQTAERLRYKGPKEEIERCRRDIQLLPGSKSPAKAVVVDYFNRMVENGMVDFDGLLYWALTALCNGVTEDPVHLLVDEMQDCSAADHMIFNRIPTTTRFYLGDPDQSIFGWRGGDGRLMSRLARVPQFRALPLDENYRCCEEVCGLANSLISKNRDRDIGKVTLSCTGVEGEVEFWTNLPAPAWEQQAIVKDIQGWSTSPLQAGHERQLGDAAVILRSNALVDQYAQALESAGVKVRRRKVPTLPEDWRFAKLAMNVLASPSNDWLASKLVAQIKSGDPGIIRSSAAFERQSVSEMFLKEFTTGGQPLLDKLALLGVAAASLARIREAISRFDGDWSLAELLTALREQEQEVRDEGDGLTVCTYHAAKGREWRTVYLPAFEQQVIPSERKSANVEEERRLAFVGVTRAKERLVVSACAKRQIDKWRRDQQEVRPSQFLAEMKGEI